MNLRDCLVRYGIVDSKRLCAQPIAVQLFFRNLLHTCDGAGRFLADADELRIALYRHALDRVTRLHVSRWMAACHSAELVRLYTGPDGRGYGEVLNYGQRDTKRRVIHPAREADQMNFHGAPPPVLADPPDPGRLELNRRGNECEETPDAFSDLGPPPRWRAARTHTPRKTSHLQTLKPAELDTYLEHLATQNPGVNIRGEIVRAEAYVRKMRGPNARLTLKYFEENWLPRAGGPSLSATAPIARIVSEPTGWRAWLNENYPDSKYSHGGTDEGTAWADLPSYVRDLVLNGLPGAKGETAA